MNTTDLPDNHQPGPPLGLGSSEVLAVTRVVWVSGGKDSTAMALRLVDLRQRFEKGDVPRNTALNRDLFEDEPTRCRACLL